jgi:hypothetical protein
MDTSCLGTNGYTKDNSEMLVEVYSD